MYTNLTTTIGYSYPDAFITKAKQRLKQFNNQVYLDDGDEYEIELFNPTSEHILAEISLDGKWISNSGIVIRPGERMFLERHIDSNNRFQFRTYHIDRNDKRALKAIQSNGNVEINFYKEQTGYTIGRTTDWIPNYPNTVYPNPIDIWYTSDNANINYAADNPPLSYSANVETGTTERGSKSNQQFIETERSFKSIPFHTINWKILPISEKRVYADDINRVYCTECGARRRRTSFKYCPHCGNQF